MLDNLDLKLIQALQENGRNIYANLATTLGVVEGTIRKRIKRLLDRNIIKIVAVPNMRELGYDYVSIMALQVGMADLREVAENLAKNQHVCYLAFTTGRYDLMGIIVTRSPKELAQFIEMGISAIPGVVRTETFVNLDIIKGTVGLMDTLQLLASGTLSLSEQ